MRNPFLAGAAVVIMTAALAACGSSAERTEKASADSAAEPSVAASPSSSVAGPPADPSDPAAQQPGKTSEPPKVPADMITPATGSFTKKQKEYLTDRVPKGMDPAAVLQTGQETCDRLSYLVKADRDVAVGSIVTGEIADAEPAVSHLCTEHKELVTEAALGYGDGTHSGKKLRPGRYRAASPTQNCSWQLAGAGGKELGSGSSDSGEPVKLTVPDSARAFTSTGCYAWLPEGDNS